MNVKVNDNVLVIAGKDKGVQGKVLATSPKANTVVVEGVRVQKKHEKARKANDTRTQIGISRRMFDFVKFIGLKSAQIPNIANTLNVFEPTTLPMATSAFPFMAPKKLTTNSGMEVPTPTMAAPITKSETLNFLAKDTDPATRKSAPKTMPTNDTIRIIYSIAI